MKSPFIPVLVPAVATGVVGYLIGKKRPQGKVRLRIIKSERQLLAERELFSEVQCKVDSDPVDRASWESFPASDSPAW